MVVSLEYELTTFFASIALAIFVGIVYDLFRALRKVTGITVIWDILMCVCVSVSVCSVWFLVQNGEIRWYMVLGTLFSGLIYFCLISEYIFFALHFVVDMTYRFFRIFFKILLTPSRFLCKIICVYVKGARSKFSKKVEEKYDEKKA